MRKARISQGSDFTGNLIQTESQRSRAEDSASRVPLAPIRVQIWVLWCRFLGETRPSSLGPFFRPLDGRSLWRSQSPPGRT